MTRAPLPPKPKTPRGRPANQPGAASGARSQRRQKIAAGVIAGKPIAAVAREQGISRTWASREANSSETKVVIASMLDRHSVKVEALVALALHAVKKAFGAMDGKKPDHRVRLIAAKRVLEMALAGRTVEATTMQDSTITWEQFEELYRSKTA